MLLKFPVKDEKGNVLFWREFEAPDHVALEQMDRVRRNDPANKPLPNWVDVERCETEAEKATRIEAKRLQDAEDARIEAERKEQEKAAIKADYKAELEAEIRKELEAEAAAKTGKNK